MTQSSQLGTRWKLSADRRFLEKQHQYIRGIKASSSVHHHGAFHWCFDSPYSCVFARCQHYFPNYQCSFVSICCCCCWDEWPFRSSCRLQTTASTVNNAGERISPTTAKQSQHGDPTGASAWTGHDSRRVMWTDLLAMWFRRELTGNRKILPRSTTS